MDVGNKLDAFIQLFTVHQIPNKASGLDLYEAVQYLCQNCMKTLGFMGSRGGNTTLSCCCRPRPSPSAPMSTCITCSAAQSSSALQSSSSRCPPASPAAQRHSPRRRGGSARTLLRCCTALGTGRGRRRACMHACMHASAGGAHLATLLHGFGHRVVVGVGGVEVQRGAGDERVRPRRAGARACCPSR